MRTWAWVALLATAMTTGCTTVRRANADYRDGDVSVWVHTPFVAVGDQLVLEVGAFDDPKVGIDTVKVWMELPERSDSPVPERLVATARGKGRYWGDTVQTSDDADLWDDSDFVRIALPVPKTKGPIKLSLAIKYAEIVPMGETFSDFDRDASIDVEVPVMSAGTRTLRRTLSGLAGLAVLIAACLLIGRYWWWLSREAGTRYGGFLPVTALLWFALGYWWFAQRLIIATGWTNDLLRWVAAIAWVAIPLIAGWRRAARRAVPAARVVDR